MHGQPQLTFQVGADGSGHPSTDDRLKHMTNGIQMLSPIAVLLLHSYPVVSILVGM